MRVRDWRLVLTLLTALGFAGPAAAGQDREKPTMLNNTQLNELIQAKLSKVLEPPVEPAVVVEERDPLQAATKRARKAERLVPVSSQIVAPGSGTPRTSQVDAASFPDVIGAAFENDLLRMQDSAFTVDLNAFAFATLLNPKVLEQQERYSERTFRLMRRFGGSLTLGGKGESFDRDGDGKAEPAETADNLGDIVTWEAKYRFKGSRDRRDAAALSVYLNSPVIKEGKPSGQTLQELAAEISDDITSLIVEHVVALKASANAQGEVDQAVVEALLAKPDAVAKLKTIADKAALMDAAAERAIHTLDGSGVWTLVSGATIRKTVFGPDKWNIGLRGDLATGSVDHAFNLDWNTIVGAGETKEAQTWKAGYQASTLILKGTPLSKEGLALSWALGAERFKDVPKATHDTIVRSSLKLVIPVNASVSVPFSINYANHQDLLTEQSYVAGHIGLAFDFSGLAKK